MNGFVMLTYFHVSISKIFQLIYSVCRLLVQDKMDYKWMQVFFTFRPDIICLLGL